MSGYEDWHYDPRPRVCPTTGEACQVSCGTGYCVACLPSAGDGMNPEVQEVAPNFVLPADSEERKKVPLWGGLFRYFPDALAEVARLSYAASKKHNPGQPIHWSRDKSSDHADCLLRHQMDCGTWDRDGFLHDAKVAWRALAQLQLALERLKQGGRR